MLPYGLTFKSSLKCTLSNYNIVFIMEVLYELVNVEVFIIERGQFMSIEVKVNFRTSG